MKEKRITVMAEIPEGLLKDYRLFIVLHGGRLLISGDEIETVENEICDQYCFYQKTHNSFAETVKGLGILNADEVIQRDYYELTEICNECPLNRL